MSFFTIIGAFQMMRGKTWSLAFAATIISIVNVGNCCCLMGLPFGIWAMVSLLNAEVKDAFS